MAIFVVSTDWGKKMRLSDKAFESKFGISPADRATAKAAHKQWLKLKAKTCDLAIGERQMQVLEDAVAGTDMSVDDLLDIR